jgi:hypothetical protein
MMAVDPEFWDRKKPRTVMRVALVRQMRQFAEAAHEPDHGQAENSFVGRTNLTFFQQVVFHTRGDSGRSDWEIAADNLLEPLSDARREIAFSGSGARAAAARRPPVHSRTSRASCACNEWRNSWNFKRRKAGR